MKRRRFTEEQIAYALRLGDLPRTKKGNDPTFFSVH
jgi:hypothetical protein